MEYQEDFKNVKRNTKQYFKSFKDKQPDYHNKELLKTWLSNLDVICGNEQYPEREVFITKCTLIFYVMGFFARSENHLEVSRELAEDYLLAAGLEQELIRDVQDCISLPLKGELNLSQKLFSDTITFYYGSDKFLKAEEDLFKEKSKYSKGQKNNKLEFLKQAKLDINEHVFFSRYGVEQLNEQKISNLSSIEIEISKCEKKIARKYGKKDSTVLQMPIKEAKDYRNLKGIDTMFKISSSNHQRLSTMADNKAHIMITVNSIILSAILTILLRKISEYQFLLLPTIIILLVSLLTIIFSILSTRPSLPKGNYSIQDINDQKVNLLFFGNFYKMSLEEYSYGMEKMMEDGDYLYSTLCKDIYMQGVVLGRKYRLLRISYNIFMYGLIVSVLAFSVASLFNVY